MSDSTGEVELRFEVEDAVVLKSDATLYGTVEKTYHALDSHTPLEDQLIIAQMPVPSPILQEFVESGRPPRGYIFVGFADERFGHSLLPEDSVILLNRSLSIGDTVKQNSRDAIMGTVVDVQNIYTLEPICRIKSPGSLIFTSPTPQTAESASTIDQDHRLPSEVSHPKPSSLIYGVPEQDVKRADDFFAGDHILSNDWLGVIEDTDIDVALLLDDGAVVWVDRPWELELIIPHFDKPLVALPEFDDIARPDVLVTNYNGITSIPTKRVSRGQFVVTNKRNMRDGRWIVGAYDPNRQPQGRVLDVRTRMMDVQWLSPNAFVRAEFAVPPAENLKPYDNLHVFRDPRDLRRNKDITLYDHGNQPKGRKSAKAINSTGIAHQAGDQVRWRDPTAAFLKYTNAEQQSPAHTHPWLVPGLRIPRDNSYGFDINECRVVFAQQHATVLWQDGSTVKVRSTSLTTVALPEADLCPGDLVTAKVGTHMIRMGLTQEVLEFNEMSFFEREYVVVPKQVGIVQSVDAKERLARVRWFESPKITLMQYAQVLANSQFGKIGEVFEEVSLYEVMTHPAFVRKRRDMVIVAPLNTPRVLPPPHIHPSYDSSDINLCGPTTLSHLRQMDEPLLPALRKIALSRAEDKQYGETPYPTYDWLGEIVDVGLDGMLTVRFGGLKNCLEIQLSHDDIMLGIDEQSEYVGPASINADPNDPDLEYLSDGTFENDSYEDFAIDEVVEYEGGKRLDEGSSEEAWMTDDEALASSEKSNFSDVEMKDRSQSPETAPTTEQNIPPNLSSASGPFTTQKNKSPLVPFQGLKPPERFSVLEQSPPGDQFRQNEGPNIGPSLLKRITREHRVLASSLPEGEIYVRTYESRLDLLRCLIIGPADTPYEYAPFLVDLHLGPKFPREPPTAHFHSWTSGLGRINPNLYEEGKICLSLLGTWPGQTEQEGWSDKATLLQLLVSLQGLVMVQQPFYNEAGFEAFGTEKVYTLESQQYSEKAYVMARGFLKHALLSPVGGLEDVLSWLYAPQRDGPHIHESGGEISPKLLAMLIWRSRRVIARSQELKQATTSGDASSNSNEGGVTISDASDVLIDGSGHIEDSTKTFLKPLSQGAMVMLEKTIRILEEIHEGFGFGPPTYGEEAWHFLHLMKEGGRG